MKRICLIQKHLKELDVPALLIENPIDLFYLTGVDLSSGQLLVTQKSVQFFVNGIYYEAASKQAPCPVTLATATAIKDALLKEKITTLAFDADWTTVTRRSLLKKQVGKTTTLKPVNHPVEALRILKSEEEQKKLKKSASLGNQGFLYAKSLLKKGVTEKEIARALEIFWLTKGGEGLAFDPIIAFGENSSKPHHKPGKRPLSLGDTVLIDCGVVLDHYASDMTRTLFFGEPDPKMRAIYQAVLQAQKAALDCCSPGVPIIDLDQAARAVLLKAGFEKLFTHSLGHGIGLETHEPPWMRQNKNTLKPGMVITIEPGAYLADVGGVRIEDTVIITKEGHQNLTRPSKKITVL